MIGVTLEEWDRCSARSPIDGGGGFAGVRGRSNRRAGTEIVPAAPVESRRRLYRADLSYVPLGTTNAYVIELPLRCKQVQTKATLCSLILVPESLQGALRSL